MAQTVISKAKEIKDLMGVNHAIEFFEKKLSEVQGEDFGALYKRAGIQTAIDYLRSEQN